MKRLLRALSILAIGVAACSCAAQRSEPTQVLVVIDAEAGVRAQAAKMQIVVLAGRDTTPVYERTFEAAREPIVLPYVLALVPRDGDAGRRFEVVVTVLDANDEFVAQVRALGGYVPHRRLLLRLLLEDSCARVSCRVDETCRSGMCTSAEVDPGSLEPSDGQDLPDASAIAAGEPDAGGMAGNGMAGGSVAGSGGTSGTAGSSGSGAVGAGQGGGGTGGASGVCDDGERRPCGTTVGACTFGLQVCAGGAWGECTGATTGGPEQCNGDDDDCDGSSDEEAPCDPADFANATQAACTLGRCRATVCEAPYGDCNASWTDGCEQLLTTLDHCGECGQECAIANAGESCATGSCVVTDCEGDFFDCNEDGTSCETELGTVDDCNACGDTCEFVNATAECVADGGGGRSCAFGACLSSRYDDCDVDESTGCERDLHTDAAHCGACGFDCAAQANVASATCDAGGCVFECVEGSVNCDGDAGNGCEASSCAHCFAAGASNFDASAYSYAAEVAFDCGGTHTFDTSTQQWDTDCCGTCPTTGAPVAQTGAGGPQVVILRAASLSVAAGTTVRLVGAYPAIFAVLGDAAIAGVIDASAQGALPGAGGGVSCGSSTGANGAGSSITGAGGGGGGGFGTSGGNGGDGGSSAEPGAGGVTRGAADLQPLTAGCGGGMGGGCPSAEVGGAGGAIQLSVAGALSVSGTLRADGGAGADGCDSEGGGSGGGSGGAILLEATVLDLSTAQLSAAGGPGGAGADGPAGGAGATSSAAGGAPGEADTFDGGSGGGGGYGRVSTRVCPAP